MPTRRHLLVATAMLAVLRPLQAAEGPRQNLLVELRWVESGVSGAVVAGMHQGAVVVGTAGSVSPRPGLSLSTRRQEDDVQQGQRLLVLNGYQASVLLAETELLQWLEPSVELRSVSGRHDRARIQVQPRSLPIERRRGFALTPHWPGGQQPVRVELRALAAGQDAQQAQMELLSTVQVALGEWVAVARSGATARRAEPGVISSSDAEDRRSRELQLRVSLAP